jgi:ribonuclease HI
MCDGIVLYTDGSFRHNVAGWGVHGYTFKDEPLKSKAATKQQPTSEGYKDVPLDETCTVVDYIDAFGRVEGRATNNTAELTAAIEGFRIALKSGAQNLVFRMDSEYVRKGMTQWVQKWVKEGWVKADGTPRENKELWLELLEVQKQWVERGYKYNAIWIKGHSNDLGNDKADVNAARGGGCAPDATVEVKQDGAKVNKLKKIAVSPLILETRMVFGINSGKEPDGYYYTYNLGRMHNAGHKPRDTAKDKLAKSDLLFGRRIAEATYCVYKANEPDEYLEHIQKLHASVYGTENPELAIINLANACNARQRNNIELLGADGLLKFDDIYVLATPEMGLVSRTLNPPRMANDGIREFNAMEIRLNEYMAGKLGSSVDVIDITSHFYEVVVGKKTVTQLKKSITQNTPHMDIPVKYKGRPINIKLVLGIDIPSRNQLNRISSEGVKVELLISPLGPLAYSYSTVFVTEDGSAIFSAPYAQFLFKK